MVVCIRKKLDKGSTSRTFPKQKARKSIPMRESMDLRIHRISLALREEILGRLSGKPSLTHVQETCKAILSTQESSSDAA